MKTKQVWLVVGVFCLTVMFTACGGGGGGGEDDQTVSQQSLGTAKGYLESGDITSARTAYTEIIDSDGENAEARFGRALCDILLLIEKQPFDNILAGFGQSPWKLNTILGSSGYLYISTTTDNYDKSTLPFYNTKTCKTTNGHWRKRCIISQMISGYTAQNIASSLDELMVYVDSIISDLTTAIANSGASYTIPKALYTGDSDININHADMVQMLAGMYLVKAGSDFANSWKFDIDLSSIIDTAGTGLLTRAEVVSLLNQQFGLRSDNKLATAKTNLQKWAEYSKQALTEVLAGSTSGVLNLTADNNQTYVELYDLAESAYNALSSSVTVSHFMPEITADLNQFFSTPANGDEIESDPFVLEGNKIKAVELWWQEMINKGCNLDINTSNAKIFSDAVRSIQYPYYSLFSAIMGHSYGKHVAGTKL